jgi:hypothetical protein
MYNVYPMGVGDVNFFVSRVCGQELTPEVRLFKLLETKEDPEADFDSMRGAIASRLRDRKVQEAEKRYFDALGSRARVIK